MVEKACKYCHRIVEGDVCPTCNGSSLSDEWRGRVIIIDPKDSKIAERLNVKDPGLSPGPVSRPFGGGEKGEKGNSQFCERTGI